MSDARASSEYAERKIARHAANRQRSMLAPGAATSPGGQAAGIIRRAGKSAIEALRHAGRWILKGANAGTRQLLLR